MSHPSRMVPDQTGLLVIDVQEKLTPRIHGIEAMTRNIAFLLDAAKVLGVLVQATEQYPNGLGTTIPELASRLPNRPDKVAFSCCAIPSVVEQFHREARRKIVLAGIEAHVCVLQTALDLLDQGFEVYVPVDAVSSRYPIDCEIGLKRMEKAGATLVTSEMAVFEWTGTSAHPRFKEISRLVQERMKL